MSRFTSTIDSGRIRLLNDKPPRVGSAYVLLWVQQDVRESCNHALEYAIEEANSLNLPLLACYGLYERFPDATERAFSFLLEGLRDARQAFAERGVRLVCKRLPPPDVAVELGEAAASVVVDCGYAKICRAWRKAFIERLPQLRVAQVETNVVVPVGLASNCREPAAATLRPKIRRLLHRFAVPVQKVALLHSASDLQLPGSLGQGCVNLCDPVTLLTELDVDRSVPLVSGFHGGGSAASIRLKQFLPKLSVYGNGKSNDPSRQDNSFLSPYLHFGQISPLDICLQLKGSNKSNPSPGFTSSGASGSDAFIEELVVRRELARNFCSYCEDYDSFSCLPDWAQSSLLQHAADARPHSYDLLQLERGETDDPCWNAAQWEMVATGHMHNYMRMYWCKQLITWTTDPRLAFAWAVRLNNRYSLDGRDENGYMGIAWCFGHHDRPFPERPIFGTVRSMTRSGLESKFNMKQYTTLVQRKCREAAAADPRYLNILPNAALGNGGAILRFVARPRSIVAAAAEQEPADYGGDALKCVTQVMHSPQRENSTQMVSIDAQMVSPPAQQTEAAIDVAVDAFDNLLEPDPKRAKASMPHARAAHKTCHAPIQVKGSTPRKTGRSDGLHRFFSSGPTRK